MEIKELIKAFQIILKDYEKAYKEDYSFALLESKHLQWGICWALTEKFNEDYYDVLDRYYKYIFTYKGGYLCPMPISGRDINILKRINFLKEEIKDLKRLLKEGYTEV